MNYKSKYVQKSHLLCFWGYSHWSMHPGTFTFFDFTLCYSLDSACPFAHNTSKVNQVWKLTLQGSRLKLRLAYLDICTPISSPWTTQLISELITDTSTNQASKLSEPHRWITFRVWCIPIRQLNSLLQKFLTSCTSKYAIMISRSNTSCACLLISKIMGNDLKRICSSWSKPPCLPSAML